MNQSGVPLDVSDCNCRGDKVILIQGEVGHEESLIEVVTGEHPEWYRVAVSGRSFSAVIPGLEAGRYRVEVTLAEVRHQVAGARVMDVVCGGSSLAAALDPIVAAGGAGLPLTIRGEIDHPGDALAGPVTIAFRARVGDALFHTIRVKDAKDAKDAQGSCVASLMAGAHHAAFLAGFMAVPEIAEPAIYQDPGQPLEERIADLMRRMSLQEKVAQMLNDAPGVERLGLNPHNYWNECLHGVGRAGVATVFPQAIGLSATWNPDLIKTVADAISTEARAKHHEALRQGSFAHYYGLTYWSPNINIFRDPRWGRGQETYGEDPFLTSRIGVAFIKGLQGDDARYAKVAACAKHFVAHSGPESERMHFDAKVSQRDLFETYLPQFEAAVMEGGVWSVMSAYNRLNETPCSMNAWLLTEVLRKRWGFRGHVVCDCGAIHWIWAYHKTTATVEEACARSVKAGCDLECGTQFLALIKALKLQMVSESEIDQALRRILEIRFRLGMLDPAETVPYAQIPASKIDCAEHGALALRVARESIVLLTNDALLPLNRNRVKRIAVIGGNADSVEVLVGNYNGTPSHPVTILEGIKRAAPDAEITYTPGCPLVLKKGETLWADNPGVREALEMAAKADCVIYVGGITGRLEGESGDGAQELDGFLDGDRTRIELPPPQTALLRALHATGTPVVFVHCSGGAVAMDWEVRSLGAIVQAWYPGQEGGTAVADVLFGNYNPAGRLPVTFYRSTEDLPPFEDYRMANRTYRFFGGKVLFPFGYGLSYTSFGYSGLSATYDGEAIRVSVAVRNTGGLDGDEVVQIYARSMDSKVAQPIRRLVGFKRVGVPRGESVMVDLIISSRELRYWDEQKGEYAVAAGIYEIEAGASSGDIRLRERLAVS